MTNRGGQNIREGKGTEHERDWDTGGEAMQRNDSDTDQQPRGRVNSSAWRHGQAELIGVQRKSLSERAGVSNSISPSER